MTRISDEDNITVGKIYNIIVKKNGVFFLCKLYNCERDALRFFRPRRSDILDTNYYLVRDILDPQPLFAVGLSDKFLFVLKHNLSF